MCDLTSTLQWEDVSSKELARSKNHCQMSCSCPLRTSTRREQYKHVEVSSLPQQQRAESRIVTTKGQRSMRYIRKSSLVSLAPGGGCDGSVVLSGAAASLSVPFYIHQQDRLCLPPQVSFWGCFCLPGLCFPSSLLMSFRSLLGRTVVAIQDQHPIR